MSTNRLDAICAKLIGQAKALVRHLQDDLRVCKEIKGFKMEGQELITRARKDRMEAGDFTPQINEFAE